MGGLFDSEEKTTNEMEVTLPDWLEGPYKSLIAQTNDLMNKEYTSYSGDRLAGFNPDETRAMDLIRSLTGTTSLSPSQDIMNQVAQRGLSGYTADEIAGYMNPYVENVLDVSRQRQIDAFDTQMNDYRARAAQAQAFGGSRFGLGEAQMQKDFGQQLADFETQGLYNAYNEGYGRAQQGTQLAGAAAMDIANLTQAQRALLLSDYNNLMGVGAQQRGMEQQELDTAYEDWAREQSYPYEQLNFANTILGNAAGTMRGSLQTQTTESSGGFGDFLGAAMSIGGMAMGIPGIGAAIGGGLGGLGGALGASGGLASSVGSMLGGASMGQSALQGWHNYNMANNNSGLYGPGWNDGGVVSFSDYADNYYGEVAPQDTSGFGLAEALDDISITQVDPSASLSEMDDYFKILAHIESSNDPEAINEHTGAAGLYQFVPSTAKAYNLEDPHDPVEALRAVKEFTQDNERVLQKKLNRPPSDAEKYLAHQQGAGTAAALLKNPKKRAVDVLTPIYKNKDKAVRAITLNGGEEDMTAGEFVKFWLSKYADKRSEVMAYADGGAVGDLKFTPFERDVQAFMERVGTGYGNLESYGLRNAADVIDMVKGVGDYYSVPEGETGGLSTARRISDDYELMQAQDRLAKGQYPVNMKKMMNQINPLVAAGAEKAMLGPDGSSLIVTEAAKPTPKVDTGKIVETLSRGAIKAPSTQTTNSSASSRSPSSSSPQQPQQPKYNYNIPLMAFGAALINPKSPMGRASRAMVSSIVEERALEQERQRAIAKEELDRRKADLYERQTRVAESNAINPYKDILKQLEVKEKLKKLDPNTEIGKKTEKFMELIMENQINPDINAAYAEAQKLAMADMVSNNIEQGRKQAPTITADQWIKQ